MPVPVGYRRTTPKRRKTICRTLAEFPAPSPLETPCRLWQGTTGSAGYGRLTDYTKEPKVTVLAHRWVWEQINGPIPEGMEVCHRCDHPLCYRLDHLFLGTHAENLADMNTKGRGAGRFPPGHKQKVTPEMAAAIRADPRTSRAIAPDYGIHHVTVTRIKQQTS